MLNRFSSSRPFRLACWLCVVSALFFAAVLVANVFPQAQAETASTTDGNVTIKSEKQIFSQSQNLVRAVGNVVIQSEDSVATSPEAFIMLGEGGAAGKVIFTKGATLTQGDKKMQAEKIVVNNQDGTVYAENGVVTTIKTTGDAGKPTTVQVKSKTQQFANKDGKLFANGNVKINYEDFKASGPKAVFHSQNNALEKIILNGGRSQVEDNQRKVTGDTVVITTNPKRFDADGNVNTQIKQQKKNTTVAGNNPTKQSKQAAASQPGQKVFTTNTPSKQTAKNLQQQMLEEEKKLNELLQSNNE